MKLLLVLSPLALYALGLGVRVLLGRTPTRHAINIEASLLLAVYFVITAGLGIFWVANQQLPPFDLHYLFGYATAALVALHLAFNLRIAVQHFGRGGRTELRAPTKRVLAVIGWGILLGLAFFLGTRAGTTELRAIGSGSAPDAWLAAMDQYHEFSSHSRAGVIARAPAVVWDEPVDPFIDRSRHPSVPLPPPGTERAPASARDVSAAALSTLLWATAGITDRRGGVALRASASSGALFPTEVYVAAWNVTDLPAGTYAYVPDRHELARLDGAPLDLAAAGAPDAAAAGPALAIVATSVFRRTGQKYRDRAYRYAVADAGHALGNALVAATEVGLEARVLTRFDESVVAASVGADDRLEGVVAVVAVHAGGVGPRRWVAPAALVPPGLEEPLDLGATSLVHRATSLRLAVPPSRGGAIALSRLADPPPPMLPLIGKRRSVRNFTDRAVSLDDAGAVLDRAAGVEPLLSRAVRVHVVASRVEGIEPGAYRFEPGSLSQTRSGALSVEAGRAALDQEVVGGAPAVVVLSFDRAVLAAEGARGYRHAFLEAGFVGARLYLAAMERGLGGCSVGAFYDEEAARLLGVDAKREWVAHFFAFGPPQP
jgi:SagB-type dehydrogenase family enzyme